MKVKVRLVIPEMKEENIEIEHIQLISVPLLSLRCGMGCLANEN